MATTITKTTTNWAMDGDDAPKFRVEHSVSDKAGCQQAACKRAGTKIQKGELRIGTHGWFEQDQKYIWQWHHWGCTTKKQLEGLQTLSGGDPENVPGYSRISPESQEQVRLALEQGSVVDKEFKDMRPDLAKFGGGGGEIRNAVGYKVEVTGRGTAGCRNAACKGKSIKIAKGELRLGIATMFDEEHMTWQYKHWKCISPYDLDQAKERWEQESLEGIDQLPEEYKEVVLESFKTGEAIELPKLEPEPTKKAKKPAASRKKKAGAEDEDEDDAEALKPKRKGPKKCTAGGTDAADEPEEPAPKKKRGRQSKKATVPAEEVADEPEAPVAPPKPREVVDPAVAKIQALTEKMRADASKSLSKRS